MNRTTFFIIVAGAMLARPLQSSAAVVPVGTPATPLASLLPPGSQLTTGPFIFDDFSLQMQELGNSWQPASAAAVSAFSVRPVTAPNPGIQFLATLTGDGLLASDQAFRLDYHLIDGLNSPDQAVVSINAIAAGGAVLIDDQLIAGPQTSSNAALPADTHWSTSSPGVPSWIDFMAATDIAVSNTTAIHASASATVSLAVENDFVPEPGTLLWVIPTLALLIRRTEPGRVGPFRGGNPRL